jgi:hypothetical protein
MGLSTIKENVSLLSNQSEVLPRVWEQGNRGVKSASNKELSTNKDPSP